MLIRSQFFFNNFQCCQADLVHSVFRLNFWRNFGRNIFQNFFIDYMGSQVGKFFSVSKVVVFTEFRYSFETFMKIVFSILYFLLINEI